MAAGLLCLILLGIGCLVKGRDGRAYKRTTYYKITKNPYKILQKDLGKAGEYALYQRLTAYEAKGAKLLFNCYLPRKPEGTTEIDALMLDFSGIYVFESKNYSGRILGKEEERDWVQRFDGKSGSSYEVKFLNPVMQNKLHIRCLKNMLRENQIFFRDIPIFSIVVFSDHCMLKEVQMSDTAARVIALSEIAKAVTMCRRRVGKRLDQKKIEKIYQILYPYTQVSEREKKQHIKNVQKRRMECLSR